MGTLEKAIALAAQAHAGQTDKGNHPYILHPLRVMLKMPTDETRIAAVLHDVLEDTAITEADLRAAGFSKAIVSAVSALTRREGESYPDFIRRASEDPIARVVKLGDIEDNLDLSRIAAPTEQDRERQKRYEEAAKLLRLRS
ncbi:HD domain-containing protein [Brevibacillus parabrevis]|uniref:HD domain-containing protein n=1 Tax=Brevibacillus parabrevis TaxID=54914 RepID=UPI0028D5EA6C|nr:HD domain-containing protein [Brevibacillus parabrevis]MED1725742.1 HD domain-containing protein [Brevibacillus parabrevis]